MKIPSYQLHHSIKEGDQFEANGFDFFCTGRDEEYLYCERVIYENDIPDMPDNSMYASDLAAETLYLTPQGLRPRWKPNGITDNIEEWEKKAGLHGEPPLKRALRYSIKKAVYKYVKNLSSPN